MSPAHPERVIGAAECRVELGQDLDKAVEELQALPASGELPPDLLARRELVHGRLLAATGHAKEGVALLTGAAKGFKSRAYDFHLALGEAAVAAGDYPEAQRAYEAALKVRASEAAKEGLARVLLGRDRPREVLARIAGGGDERRLALVRGIAHADLEEWARARAELGRTQVGGKYPSEAVVYLALADAAQGEAAAAQATLERALSATKKAKADIRVALGRVYWKQGQTDKAREQFEAAAREGRDYEAPCALGRLQLALGSPDQALAPLEQAVERNGSHGEARAALGRLYLMLGRLQDGLAGAQAWAGDEPQDPGAQQLLALALHLSGSWKEADAASARAVKAAPQDAEAHRIRAMVLFSIGDARAALSELQRANKLDPRDPNTFCEIGHAFLRQNNGAHAEAAFSAALREQPFSDCGAIGAQLSKLPSGAKPAARVLAERAEKSKAAWDRGQAYAALARAELAMGAAARAKKAAEQAVAVAPYLGNAHWALGLCAARQKDGEKAKAELRRAADLEPAHAGIRLAAADFLARTGDLEAAIRDYEILLKLGGEPAETSRVRKALPELKKRLASR